MTKNATILLLIGLLLISSGILLIATTGVGAQEEGDAVRGGLLYDQWWAVLGQDAPEGDQPLWVTQETNTRSGADTWRCKECHGWDYMGADGAYGSGSHFTGFPGVISLAGADVETIVAALSGETNPDHDFSAVMEEHDLLDLATFISEDLIDPNALIGTGDAAAGEELYATVCAFCHGPEGNAINFAAIDDPEFLGHLAGDNPWEFVHKVRFGQPGWPMPSAIVNGWSDQDVADTLAYAESFTTEPALSGGAQLYDQWWTVLGQDTPEGDQPLWATQDTNTRSGADTWRCKECHGWDYLGADGAYGSGSHLTGFPGVLGTEDPRPWLTGEANADHDFSVMGEAGVDALVDFLTNEMVDISDFVNDDGTVNGDPVLGRELFEGTCAACHGVDGQRINFGNEDEPEYVGTVASDNPWEFFHKVGFGQPGEPMPMGYAMGWVIEDFADIAAYAQTLPE